MKLDRLVFIHQRKSDNKSRPNDSYEDRLQTGQLAKNETTYRNHVQHGDDYHSKKKQDNRKRAGEDQDQKDRSRQTAQKSENHQKRSVLPNPLQPVRCSVNCGCLIKALVIVDR